MVNRHGTSRYGELMKYEQHLLNVNPSNNKILNHLIICYYLIRTNVQDFQIQTDKQVMANHRHCGG